MKKILLVIIGGIGMLTVTAQNLSLAFNGGNQNRNYQAVIDGTSYYSNATVDANTTTNGTNRTITIPGLQPGSHTLEVYRIRNNSGVSNNGTGTDARRALYTNTVNLRTGYDMLITVNGNGNVSITEKRIRRRGGLGNQTNITPMATATFETLLRNTRAQWNQSRRVTAVSTAFGTTGNYFTTAQARELLLLVTAEGNRLNLAKIAYGKLTDAANFTSLYDLFRNQASITELNAHIRLYPNTINAGTFNGNTGSGTVTTTTRVAMDDATYNAAYKQASDHILPWNRAKEVNALFTNPAYYFNVAQINQLLNVVSSGDKLAMAKLAWNRVTDPVNFTQTVNLFTTQAERDELNAYVQARPF